MSPGATMMAGKPSTSRRTRCPGKDDFRPLNKNRTEKDASIETVRGLIISLLVCYHAQGFLRESRDMDTLLSEVHQQFRLITHCFMMPVFAAMAGYVYAIRPSVKQSISHFIAGKCKRLLLPFFFAVTLIHVLRSVAPGINNPKGVAEIWQAFVYPPDQFWFIQSLFFVFIVIVLLERAAVLSKWQNVMTCVVLSITAVFTVPGPSFMHLWGVIYLTPYFLAGLGMARWSSVMKSRSLLVTSCVSLAIGFTLLELTYCGRLDLSRTRTGLPAFMIGFAASYLMLRFRRPIRILAVVGTFSYSISLYHGFGLALAKRIPLGGDNHEQFTFLLASVLGVVLPIFMQLIVRRMPVLPLVMFGERSAGSWYRPAAGIHTQARAVSSDEGQHATSAWREAQLPI